MLLQKKIFEEFIKGIQEECLLKFNIDPPAKFRVNALRDKLTNDTNTSLSFYLRYDERLDEIEDVDDVIYVDNDNGLVSITIFGNGSFVISTFPLSDVQLSFKCCDISINGKEFEAIVFIRNAFLKLIGGHI